MARKPPTQTVEEPCYLAVSREEAAQRIADRIKHGEELKSQPIKDPHSLDIAQKDYYTWNEYNSEMLRRVFTTTKITSEYESHRRVFFAARSSFQQDVKEFLDDIDGKIRCLVSISKRLELFPLAPGSEHLQSLAKPAEVFSNNKVFLVHGHDEGARETVARFLERLGLEAVILHEQANQGRTIVEKLEHHNGARFAVVLLTPDDVGGKTPTELQPRARQNVILELGYFLARLGRQRVCALHRGEVEIPSDYMGVIYIKYDGGAGWKLELARELKAAEFQIDMNDAI
jgi:predicted nucleotide-binding protein